MMGYNKILSELKWYISPLLIGEKKKFWNMLTTSHKNNPAIHIM